MFTQAARSTWADLNLNSSLDVRDTGSIVHMNGNNINANQIFLGYYDSQAVTLDRGTTPGSLTANYLYVGNNNFDLLAIDSVANFYLDNSTSTLYSNISSLQIQDGSTATTTATGTVSGSVSVYSGSTLNLAADLNLNSSLDVRDTGSVVHMNGNNINANQIYLGWYDNQAVTLDRGTTPGSLTANSLHIGNNNFDLLAIDSVANFYLDTSHLYAPQQRFGVTADSGWFDGHHDGHRQCERFGQCLLRQHAQPGADLNLNSSLDVRDTGSIVHMNGNNINANQIFWDGTIAKQ